MTRNSNVLSPGRPKGGTDFDFDTLPDYKADAAVYREIVEGNIGASLAGAAAGAPCTTATVAGGANHLVFCTSNGVLVVAVLDAGANLVTSATNRISIASTPPGVAGATTVVAAGGIATFDQLYLNSPGTYTLTARADGLTAATGNSFSVAANLDRAKIFRNKIVDKFRGKIDDVYGEYTNVLYTGRGIQGLTSDFINLGLTAATTISLVTRTKTILAAIATGVTGVSLSIDKNFFGQQTVAALAIAMQARRDLAKKTILQNEQSSVTDYSLDMARDDLIAYFYSGTLIGALQEVQEEAATKSANITNPPGGTAGAAKQLAIVAPASGGTNNLVMVEVHVEDGSSKVVTSATNSITISVSPSTGNVGGNLTASAVAGVATFYLTFSAAGNYTLTASSNGLTSATSPQINVTAVNAGAAFKLGILHTSNVLVNQPLDLRVEVEDNSGNRIPGATNSVTLSIAPNTAQGATTVSAVAGIATFNLTFTAATSYTVTAHSDGLMDGQTTIKPAALSQFLLAPVPSQIGIH